MTNEKSKAIEIYDLPVKERAKLSALKEGIKKASVTSEIELEQSAELLISIKKAKSFVEGEFDGEEERLKPGYDLYTMTRKKRKSYTDLLESMARELKGKVGEYHRKKEAEQRRLEEEAKKLEEERLKKLEEKKAEDPHAEILDPVFVEDEIIDSPVETVAPSARSKVITTEGATGTYKVGDIEVTDIKKVLREVAKGTLPLNSVELRLPIIKKYMKDFKDLEVPGIKRVDKYQTKVY